MKNQSLYQSYNSLCSKAFSVIRPYLDQKDNSPFKNHTAVPEQEPNFVEFMDRYKNDLFNLPEYNDFLENVKNDVEVSQYFSGKISGTFLTTWRLEPEFFIRFVVAEVSRSYQQSGHYDEALVNSIYIDLEKLVYDDTISIIEVIPLDNFDSETDIILEQGFSIRRITSEEKKILMKILSEPGQIITFSRRVENWKFVIEFTYHAQKLIIDLLKQGYKPELPNESRHDAISSLLLPIRIFKDGPVGCSLFLSKNRLNLPGHSFPNKQDIYVTRVRGATLGHKKYFLKASEVSELQKFYNLLKNIDYGNKRSPLDKAISQFGFSYRRERLVDKIVDYAISLEVLFAQGRGSIRQKISDRCSRLVSDSLEDRKRVGKDLKDFYYIRSSIVHPHAS